MAISYRDLFDVNLKYLDFIVTKTLVIHQYLHGIKSSGDSVESEVRELLRRVVPARFRVTHGYIVSASNAAEEPSVSPQVDVIIVDTLVPHSLWTVDDSQGVEIVPIEAVVAIIEVKRTLTEKALTEAALHLQKIRDRVGVEKYSNSGYLPGGVTIGAALTSPYRSNPLFGIFGIIGDPWLIDAPSERFKELVKSTDIEDKVPLELDMILSLDGTLVATADSGSSNYQPHHVRVTGEVYPVNESSARAGHAPRQALAFGLGFLLAYLDKSCGRMANIVGYFFNDHLMDEKKA